MVFSRKVKATAVSQRGQALPLGLAFILFGSLLAIVLFNTGQMTSEKSRLANTADAAVYSGLVWQARALNYQAYTNRAMVANQVSIGQFVSLKSWTIYGEITAVEIDASLGSVPPFKPFTAGVSVAMSVIKEISGVVSDIAVPIISSVNAVLSQSQTAVYLSALIITPSIVSDVVKKNGENYKANSAYAVTSMLSNATQWYDFASRYDDEAGIKRKADIINDSRDEFTANRAWDFGRITLFPLRFELVKQGATKLQQKDGTYAWNAVDTLSLYPGYYKCSFRKGCGWSDPEVPVSVGGAFASEDICPPTGCGLVSRNSKAERFAKATAKPISGYMGVQAYYEITDLSENNKDPRIHLRVEVEVDQSDVGTSTKKSWLGSPSAPSDVAKERGIGAGLFWTEDKAAAEQMASIGSGEIYFERPTPLANPGKKEYGNLFNPYWQVRLTEVPEEERLAAWLLRSPDLASSASGVASGLAIYASQQVEELEGLQQLATYSQTEIDALSTYGHQQAQLTSQISGVDAQISSLESSIALAQKSGTSTSAYLAEQQITLSELHAQKSTAFAELQSIESKISTAEQLQSQLVVVQGQVAATTSQLEQDLSELPTLNAFSQDLSQAQGLVGHYGGSAKELSKELTEMGRDALNDAVKESLVTVAKELMEKAAMEVLDGLTGGGATFAKTAAQQLQSMEEDAKQELNAIAAEVDLQPLAKVINESANQLEAVKSGIEAEVDAAIGEGNAEIARVSSEMTQEVTNLANNIQSQLDDLLQVKASFTEETTKAIVEDTNKKIAQLQLDIVNKPAALRADYQAQIDSLEQVKKDFLASRERQVQEATSQIDAEVSKNREQLNALLQ